MLKHFSLGKLFLTGLMISLVAFTLTQAFNIYQIETGNKVAVMHEAMQTTDFPQEKD